MLRKTNDIIHRKNLDSGFTTRNVPAMLLTRAYTVALLAIVLIISFQPNVVHVASSTVIPGDRVNTSRYSDSIKHFKYLKKLQ